MSRVGQLYCFTFDLKNKDSLSAGEIGNTGSTQSGPPSMADVLKGLSTVKLRAILR